MNVLVLGGGPAGMAAAIAAARGGAAVTLLERNDRIGKKLLLTGNGKCNYTNLDLRRENYDSDAPALLLEVLIAYHVLKKMRKNLDYAKLIIL